MKNKKRQRILLVGPYPPPDAGVALSFKLFCDWLAANYAEQYEFKIVPTRSGDKALVSFYHPVVLAKLAGIGLRLLWGSLRSDRVVIFGSNRFISFTGSVAAVLLRPLGKPVALRIFGGAFEVYLAGRSKAVEWLIRKAFGLTDRIVVQPQLVADALKDVWPRQLRCVRNYRLPIADLPPRQFDGNVVRFVYAGNIRRTKGCQELFLAFAQVRNRLAALGSSVRVKLDMFGPIYGVEREAVEGIAEAQRDPDIVFHGQVSNSELLAAMQRFDVFVFPTYWPTEGHSGAIIEAMFCGLPTIASDWRANAEVVRDGITGLICKTRDVVSLADCMLRLAMDGELRRSLSAGALEQANWYDIAAVGPEMAEALGL
jgi:glycosyltransferase involved in cell wall biosynthesis